MVQVLVEFWVPIESNWPFSETISGRKSVLRSQRGFGKAECPQTKWNQEGVTKLRAERVPIFRLTRTPGEASKDQQSCFSWDVHLRNFGGCDPATCTEGNATSCWWTCRVVFSSCWMINKDPIQCLYLVFRILFSLSRVISHLLEQTVVSNDDRSVLVDHHYGSTIKSWWFTIKKMGSLKLWIYYHMHCTSVSHAHLVASKTFHGHAHPVAQFARTRSKLLRSQRASRSASPATWLAESSSNNEHIAVSMNDAHPKLMVGGNLLLDGQPQMVIFAGNKPSC